MRPAVPPGPYLVAGTRRAGSAAARALAKHSGPQAVTVWDGIEGGLGPAVAEQMAELGVAARAGGDGLTLLDGPDAPRTLVKSPGIPFRTPIIREAVRRGLFVIDEAELGWRLEARPVVAVTGTNGKSTTAALTVAVLAAGGSEAVVAGNTTFGPPLSALESPGADVVVAELSSFQLEGCTALRPDAALLTNLTHDHVLHHGSPAAYAAAKRSLFVRDGTAVAVAVVGIDQAFGLALAEELRAVGSRVVTFGRHPDADRRLLEAEWTLDGARLMLSEGDGERRLTARLVGEHNALNVAGALALADALGIDPASAAAAVADVAPLPGRFEGVRAPAGFDVVVDFAHNADGVALALNAARSIADARGAAVRVVCSALGFSGSEQAYEMGWAAAERADHLVLTTHRWRPEESLDLNPGLEDGARAGGSATVQIVPDRGEAIAAAIGAAGPGDVVMVLERGAVGSAIYDAAGNAAPFDDRAVVRSLLQLPPVAQG